MHMRNLIVVWIGTVLGWPVSPVHAELTLGVHPFKPAATLVAAFTPLTEYLSVKLGEPVVVRIAKDYQTHIDTVGRDQVDIAYLGPVPYVKLRDAYGARPLLARQQIGTSPVFRGTIFVRHDSPLKTLADLRGKRFAFGEPHSTMSHLVPRYMLWQAGVPVEQLAGHKFVGDHVNVALAVLAGDFDAGAVKEDVFVQYRARGLRALATSVTFSDHVFVASRKLPAAQLATLRAALLELHRQPDGPSILGSLTRGVTQLVPAQDSDYDGLREVLRKLRELGVET